MAEQILVAVVDDSVAVRDLVQMVLEEEGYNVLSAGAASEAIVLMDREANTCCALITDVDLGDQGYTGWDLARKARERYPRLAVVYIAAAGGHAWSAVGVPDSVLLNKPFVLDHLVTELARLLGSSAPPDPSV